MKLTTAFCLLVSCAAFAATEETIKTNFPAASGGKLVVDVSFGSIDVATNGVGDEIAVDIWRKITRKKQADEEQFLKDYPVEFLRKGDTLTVRCLIKEKGSWWSGRNHRNEAKYTILVPARFHANLDTSGGGIGVSDITGEVKADTSGGGLRFTRIEGPLTGDTSGGDIHVKDCKGMIKMETSGGGITVENVKGALIGETSGGSINAVLPSPIPGPVKLSTSGGGVTLKVAGDAVFHLDAKTSGGGVSCELPVTVQGKTESGHLKGPVNGGGEPVVLRSSGGSIRVKKL